eukprot:8048754-Karenia_brevis.AAC.2
MSEVPAWAWPSLQDITYPDGDTVRAVRDCEMHAVAFYNEAVGYKEEEHLPLIGASVDRGMLSLMYKALNREAVKAYCCLACAIVRTYVRKRAKFHRQDD